MIQKSILLCCVILIYTSVFAQEKETEAFSKIAIEAQFTRSVSINDLDEFWEMKYGAKFNFNSPFYFGFIGIGIDYNKFSSFNQIQPNFSSVFISLNLTQKAELFFNTKLFAGIKFGSFIMMFDTSDETEFESTESEMAIGAIFGYQVPLSNKLSIISSTNFTTVFTNKKLKIWNISAGLVYEFDSPIWFKEFMN
jgi:hypothetical protein